MTLLPQTAFPGGTPPARDTIPLTSHQFGSWQVAISRRPRSPEALAGRYDALSTRWRRTAQRFQLETCYREALIASNARAVLAAAGNSAAVLDCGVGSGSLSLALAGLLAERAAFTGVDMSANMLTAADAALRQAGLSPELAQANILALPFADRSFDVVMAAHVVEHLPEPQAALREMCRVLKPGGLLFVCMTRRSLFGALVQLAWRTWAITERQATAWLHQCQLTEIGVRPLTLGPYAGKASLAFWARRPGGFEGCAA